MKSHRYLWRKTQERRRDELRNAGLAERRSRAKHVRSLFHVFPVSWNFIKRSRLNLILRFATKGRHVYESDIKMPKKPKKAGSLSQLLKKARRVVKRGERLIREREAELARMDAYVQAQRESTKPQSPLF